MRKLRKSNIDEIDFNNQNYIVAKPGERIPFIEANIRSNKVIDKNRSQTLFKYGINLLLLNPDITIEEMIEDIFLQNKIKCINPLPKHSIEKIVEVIFTKKRNNDIINTNTGNIIKFNPKSKMNKNQKLAEVSKVVGERRTKEVIEKIINVLENWNFDVEGKVTAKKISTLSNVGTRTIERYYSIFKNNIQEMNKTKNPPNLCYNNYLIDEAVFLIKNKKKEKEVNEFIFGGNSELPSNTNNKLNNNNLEKNTSTMENEITGPITLDDNGNVIILNNTSTTIEDTSTTIEDTSTMYIDGETPFSNYNLKTIEGIQSYLNDNNIVLHPSISIADFVKNPRYLESSEEDKIKYLR